jgi:hypothetical protein
MAELLASDNDMKADARGAGGSVRRYTLQLGGSLVPSGAGARGGCDRFHTFRYADAPPPCSRPTYLLHDEEHPGERCGLLWWVGGGDLCASAVPCVLRVEWGWGRCSSGAGSLTLAQEKGDGSGGSRSSASSSTSAKVARLEFTNHRSGSGGTGGDKVVLRGSVRRAKASECVLLLDPDAGVCVVERLATATGPLRREDEDEDEGGDGSSANSRRAAPTTHGDAGVNWKWPSSEQEKAPGRVVPGGGRLPEARLGGGAGGAAMGGGASGDAQGGVGKHAGAAVVSASAGQQQQRQQQRQQQQQLAGTLGGGSSCSSSMSVSHAGFSDSDSVSVSESEEEQEEEVLQRGQHTAQRPPLAGGMMPYKRARPLDVDVPSLPAAAVIDDDDDDDDDDDSSELSDSDSD